MRTFELIDGERPGVAPCAIIRYYPLTQKFSVIIADWAGPRDVPIQFAAFLERGERTVPGEWVDEWVSERIAPPSRQNIGSILREHKIEKYDPCTLLMSAQGRSTQDGFYLREITSGYRRSYILGESVRLARSIRGVTQAELAEKSGLSQEAISRIERGNANPSVGTLEKIAEALDLDLTIKFDLRKS